VTHPFHPLFGQQFEAVTVGENWGENRVHYRDGRGRLVTIPTLWTSLAAEDPFVVVAAGRSCLRVAELIRLAEIIERSREETRR